MLAGWTLGAGLEYALARNWSLKGEYLYYDLGHLSTAGSSPLLPSAQLYGDVAFKGSIARVGINYALH